MIKSISDKWVKISIHVIVWIILIAIPIYLQSVVGVGDNLHKFYDFYINTFSAIIVFYVGYLWLVPKYFLQNKKLLYIVLLFGLIFTANISVNYIEKNTLQTEEITNTKPIPSRPDRRPDHSRRQNRPYNIFNYLIISGFTIMICAMEKLKRTEKRQKELEQEKLHSELAFLKNQISPHFFFNTLNNIYSLTGIDVKIAQESILKLSKMMRYLLYESEQGETLMSKEIEFMNNYIDLMKLRLSKKVKVEIEFPTNFTDFSIPPLIFISFIENAFKHGVSNREPSYININMTIDKDQILFLSENTKFTNNEQNSGIGLENVKKRLNLLFPNKHTLKIENDNIFKVELIIKR